MYEFYQKKYQPADLKRSRKSLQNLYDAIPETEGCKENNSKPGGCGSWCCELQTPQVMFIEFLNTWNTVTNTWSKEDFKSLWMRAVATYLGGKTTNGCIFWDKDTKHCMQHSVRPFNCRVYGQTPEEEFKSRYEKLKVLYENTDADIRPQCDLVKTVGVKPTIEDMKSWFKELTQLESDIIPTQLISDDNGGSYRTFHDHILLKMASPEFLDQITKLRTKGTVEQKQEFLNELSNKLENNSTN